jgi:hypothetical protein
MKLVSAYPLFFCFVWLLNGCFAPTSVMAGDPADRTEKNLNYGSMGAGYGTGFFCSGGFSHMYNLVGMSISMNGLWYRARDLPEDYTGVFTHDNVYTIAFRGAFGGSPDGSGNTWLGIEVGPSYVNFRKEVETPNPDYGWWNWDKYLRDNLIFHTIGLSGRMRFDFMFSAHVGMELALGFNLNRYKSNFGFESCFLFGKLK